MAGLPPPLLCCSLKTRHSPCVRATGDQASAGVSRLHQILGAAHSVQDGCSDLHVGAWVSTRLFALPHCTPLEIAAVYGRARWLIMAGGDADYAFRNSASSTVAHFFASSHSLWFAHLKGTQGPSVILIRYWLLTASC